MRSETQHPQADKTRVAMILILYALSIIIILLGAAFSVFSVINHVQLAVMSSNAGEGMPGFGPRSTPGPPVPLPGVDAGAAGAVDVGGSKGSARLDTFTRVLPSTARASALLTMVYLTPRYP